jgi:hypothetical protein
MEKRQGKGQETGFREIRAASKPGRPKAAQLVRHLEEDAGLE